MTSGGDLIGKTLGKCRILGRLGHGRTSSIYRAHYAPLNKEVAVKILRKDAKATPELREKFLNEARALGRLDHPNIVKVFDVVEEGPYLFIIMELIRGDDLAAILARDGHVEVEEAVAIVTRVAKALAEAHRQEIVHRDVKPANIMLAGPRGQVKLVDFGLATKGVTTGRAGTPHYMSPEQIQGRKVTDKSDIYALGATFFHMLTGQPPYPAKTAKVIREKHLEGKLPTPSRVGRALGVPRAVDPVVKRMMAPIPGYRFSARDLVAALEDLNLGSGGRHKRTRSARAASRRSRNMPLLLGAVGLLAVVLVAAILIAVSGGERKKPAETAAASSEQKAGDGEIKSIRNRADDLRNRQILAENEYRAAQSFEAANFGKDSAIYNRYKEVWDKYGDTAPGEKARQRMKEIDQRIRAKEIAAKRRAEEEKLRTARPVFLKELGEHQKKYDFAAAAKRVVKYLDDYEVGREEEAKLFELLNRFEYASEFLRRLGERIGANPKKYPVKFFKPDGPEGVLVVSGDEANVVTKQGELERKREWSYFTPEELGRMAGRQFGLRDPMSYYLKANFFLSVGLEAEGRAELENALGMDRTGAIAERERRVKKEPSGKIHRLRNYGDQDD